jgi:prepilin-type N-terminal cleavage/methylation domain-containing protein
MKKGFTLVEVIIAVAILGGIALGVMSLMKNMYKGQSDLTGSADLLDLRREITYIFEDNVNCGVSLKGTVFRGDSINMTPIENLEIWNADEAGNKLSKKFFQNQNYGKLTIDKISFFIPSHTTNVNWPEANGQTANGTITIEGKKNLLGTIKPFKSIKTNIKVLFNTDSSGNSKIESCSMSSSGNENDFSYPSSCSLTMKHRDNGGAIRSTTLDMSSPGFVGLRFVGNVNNDDQMYISSNCTANDPIDQYFKSCQFSLGEKDSTSNANANLTPSRQASTSFDNTEGSFFYEGDVNSDDSVYFRARCPETTDQTLKDAEKYIKSSCRFCMGYSDVFRPQPDTQICTPIKEMSDNSWARFRLTGDVNSDDIMFIGFFCQNEYSPIVKNIVW